MVDFEAFGDWLRNAIRDISGGGARDLVRPVENIGGLAGNLIRDVEGGLAGGILRDIQWEKPFAKVGERIEGDVSGFFRDFRDLRGRDVGIFERLRRDVTAVGSRIRRDLGEFADFFRRHKLAIGLGAGLGLAGLGAYEFLQSGNNYNSQLNSGLGGGAGGLGGGEGGGLGGGGLGLGGAGAGGQCDPTCGQIPELPPCPQCGTGLGGLGGGLGTGGEGGGGSIFGDLLLWIIIAIVVIIIIIIVLYHKKKR